MHIAVIGAGYTGLSAAWTLRKKGHQVTIFEASDRPGGLAAGFRPKQWDWSIEHHYHHIFESDRHIQHWLTEMGLNHHLFFSTVRTSTYQNGAAFRLDSPLTLLTCPALSLVSRLRTAIGLGLLKLFPAWRLYEKITAKQFICTIMGQESWRTLWEPLFRGKFGDYAQQVNAAWFWARIVARSERLGYFTGGFAHLAQDIVDRLKNIGVEVQYATPITRITPQTPDKKKKAFSLQFKSSRSHTHTQFDQVIVAAPRPIFTQLCPDLPSEYIEQISTIPSLAAQTCILELDRPFFTDQTYWMNINEPDWPFLAVVEHTNLTGRSPYAGNSLVYVGKYLDRSDPLFEYTETNLADLYHPYLNKLSPGYAAHVQRSWLFRAPVAQPITLLDHSQRVPTLTTPIAGLYWASLEHIYPWDRGTNFAVELGQKVAQKIG